MECLEAKGKSGRTRSMPKRGQARKDAQDQADQEVSAERRDKQRTEDEEKRRQEKHEKVQLIRKKRRSIAIKNAKKTRRMGECDEKRQG